MNQEVNYAGGILTNNLDYTKLFLGNNRYISATYTNGTGAPITLNEGQVLGRIFATGKVTPLIAASTNGSQLPLGVLRSSYTVAAAASVTVQVCISGDVASELLLFNASETASTVVLFNSSSAAATTTQAGQIGDLIYNRGIFIITNSENTLFDN